MRRFLADWTGNYVFFVPFVGSLNWLIAGWTWEIFVPYALISVPMAAVGGPLYTKFSVSLWNKLWRIKW